MSLEVLTNMLPHSVSLEYSGSSVPELTSAEWAAILIGATDHEYNLAMLIYCSDTSKAPSLARYLLTLPIPFKNKKVPVQTLPSGQRDVIRAISHLSVSDYAENSLCMICKGEKVVYTVTCPACNGAGYKQSSDYDRESYVGIKRGQWREYEPVYQRFLIKLGAMDTANKIRYRQFVDDNSLTYNEI